MKEFTSILYSSYINGGSIWPQIRGGINIYVLGAIAEIQSSSKINWRAFLESKLSDKEISSTINIMTNLHNKFGIILPKEVDLQDEWRSAKAAVFKSILHFILCDTPEYKSSLKELLTYENAEIIERFENNNPSKIKVFYEFCKNSKAELKKHNDLGDLFSHSISKIKVMSITRFNDICAKYNLKFHYLDDYKTIANHCLYTVYLRLNEKFNTKYPKYLFSSVCWGFDPPQYLK